MLLDLLVAFAAGAVSLLSPCMLPLLPGWLAYLAGDVAVESDRARAGGGRLVLHTCAFVLGFTVVFIMLGLGAAVLGGQLLSARRELEIVGGLLIAGFGVAMVDERVLPRRLRAGQGMSSTRRVRGPLGALVVGFVFALAWSPCIGPTLAAVLTIAATGGDAARGAILLAAFGLGIGVPLILVAGFAEQLLPRARRLHRHLPRIRVGAGIVLVAFGLLVAAGIIGRLSSRLSGIIPIEI